MGVKPMKIEEVAQKAGVSRSTVSRVLNNHRYVKPETRARVMTVIEQEGYSPHPAARILARQRTRVIGIVIPHAFTSAFDDPDYLYFPTLVQGITTAAQEHDYAAMLWITHCSEDEQHYYQRILQNRLMDGLILASVEHNNPLAISLLENGTPFVSTERPLMAEDRISYVSIDNVQGGRVATEHLIRLGRRRIGAVTGRLSSPDGLDRLEGYKLALRDANIPFDPDLVVEAVFNRKSGYLATRTLLRRGVDAIFAGNDSSALGVLDALHEAGVRVPEDVAVIGFDDLPTAIQATPPLTTIRQPILQRGARALALLVDLLEGRAQNPRQVLLPTQLVIRESCGSGQF